MERVAAAAHLGAAILKEVMAMFLVSSACLPACLPALRVVSGAVTGEGGGGDE
jgi:hypothetical protein